MADIVSQFQRLQEDLKMLPDVEFAGSNSSFRGAYINVQAKEREAVEEIVEEFEEWDVKESPREARGNWRIKTGPP